MCYLADDINKHLPLPVKGSVLPRVQKWLEGRCRDFFSSPLASPLQGAVQVTAVHGAHVVVLFCVDKKPLESRMENIF